MILIVGGLIAVGIIAAIAVVFLALGEQRGRTANVAPVRQKPANPAEAQQAEVQVALATANTGVPTLVETREEKTPDQTVRTEQDQSGRQEQAGRVLAAGEEQLAAGLASQYEVLTRELQEVHQKSNEIERRLGLLNEIATRFEQIQDGRSGNGEEGHNGTEEGWARRNEGQINTEIDLRPTPSRVLDPYR